MKLYRDEGIVLRSIRLGETDRIVSIFTKEHGRVRAVAKGVRKTSSKFGGRLEPLSHIAVQFYAGRDLDTVTQVETIEANRAIREDLDLLTRAATMLEVVDRVSIDREPNEPLAQMLINAVSTLATTRSQLVVPAFSLKVLVLEGVGLQVRGCVVCQSDDELVAFVSESGGLACRSCRAGGISVSREAIHALQLILGGSLSRALEETQELQVIHELDALATRAIEAHLERRLRSGHNQWV